MNPIDYLKQEHEDIERELIELETIINDMDNEINYPNLVHVFRKLHKIWNEHEKKEDEFFPILERKRINIPVEKMLFEHKLLRKHKTAVYKAFISGSEFEIKKALNNDLKIIIEKLREHINDEDDVLYILTLEEFDANELNKIWNKINENVEY